MVSIIVPVYKVEKYIDRCIESIIKQTYADWELILVDDGSPDRSGKICDSYAARESRIKVYHKENGGVSSARNLGLDKANGAFILFVDSDDWLNNNCLQYCIDTVIKNDLDIFQFRSQIVDDNGPARPYCNNYSTGICTPSVYIDKYKELGIQCTVWSNIFKRSLFEEHNIRFDTRMSYNEDNIVFFKALVQSSKIQATDRIFYNYYDNGTGAMRNISFARKLNDDKLYCDFLASQPLLDWKYLAKALDLVFCWNYNTLSSIEKGQLHDAWNKLPKRLPFLSMWHAGVRTKLFAVLNVISFSLALNFISTITHFRNK